MPSELIRILVRQRDSGAFNERVTQAPREAFWRPLRAEEEYSNVTIPVLEGRLEHNLGSKLKEELVGLFRQRFAEFESRRFDRIGPGGLEELLYRGIRGDSPAAGEAFASYLRMVEAREQFYREDPTARRGREKFSLAQSVLFKAKVEGYGSQSLTLAAGPIEALGKVFDFDVAAFEVFLQEYLPKAYGETLTEDFSDQLAFDITIPDGFGSTFRKSRREFVDRGPGASALSAKPAGSVISEAQKKAELVWRVANGTLLIPVALALAVMLYGFREVAAVQRSQQDALKPILEHQTALLKEDRERFADIRLVDSLRRVARSDTSSKAQDTTKRNP